MIETRPGTAQNMEEAMKRPGVNGGMMKKMDPDRQPVNYVLVESVDRVQRLPESRRQDCCPQDTDPKHGSSRLPRSGKQSFRDF